MKRMLKWHYRAGLSALLFLMVSAANAEPPSNSDLNALWEAKHITDLHRLLGDHLWNEIRAEWPVTDAQLSSTQRQQLDQQHRNLQQLTQRMETRLRQAYQETLDRQDVEAMTAFYHSDLGKRWVQQLRSGLKPLEASNARSDSDEAADKVALEVATFFSTEEGQALSLKFERPESAVFAEFSGELQQWAEATRALFREDAIAP